MCHLACSGIYNHPDDILELRRTSYSYAYFGRLGSSPRKVAKGLAFTTFDSMPTPRLCRLLGRDSGWEGLGLCLEAA